MRSSAEKWRYAAGGRECRLLMQRELGCMLDVGELVKKDLLPLYKQYTLRAKRVNRGKLNQGKKKKKRVGGR